MYKRQGLITASAGNHAQGVAYAAKCYGVKAVIVMPTTTPLIKVERTKSYGAEVILYGDVYDEACAHEMCIRDSLNAVTNCLIKYMLERTYYKSALMASAACIC